MESKDLIRLIDEIKDGNEVSFRKFFDYYYPRFLRIAHFYIRNNETAEEVVMDVFSKLWKKRKSLKEINHFNNYTYTAVKNQSLKYIRKRKIDLSSMDDYTMSNMIDYIEPEKLFIGKELAIELELVVRTLPARCQIIYRLVREDGLKYKNVAEILSISQKGVENQMLIAAKRIRIVFERYAERSVKKNFSSN